MGEEGEERFAVGGREYPEGLNPEIRGDTKSLVLCSKCCVLSVYYVIYIDLDIFC